MVRPHLDRYKRFLSIIMNNKIKESPYLKEFLTPYSRDFKTKMVKVSNLLLRHFGNRLTSKVDLDYIACTGSSGLMSAIPLSMQIEVPILFLRHLSSGSHSNVMFEAPFEDTYSKATRVIMVDDFIETGETILRLSAALKENGIECEDAIMLGEHDKAVKWYCVRNGEIELGATYQ